MWSRVVKGRPPSQFSYFPALPARTDTSFFFQLCICGLIDCLPGAHERA